MKAPVFSASISGHATKSYNAIKTAKTIRKVGVSQKVFQIPAKLLGIENNTYRSIPARATKRKDHDYDHSQRCNRSRKKQLVRHSCD